jgi:hypothetical protein
MTQPLPRPRPDGLAASGGALWDSVAGVLALDEHEALALLQACRTADMLDTLQAVVDRDGVTVDSPQGTKAHPALTELRAQRVVFARLVAALRLPSGLADRKAKKEKQHEAAKQVDADEKVVIRGHLTQGQRRAGARGVYAIDGGKL